MCLKHVAMCLKDFWVCLNYVWNMFMIFSVTYLHLSRTCLDSVWICLKYVCICLVQAGMSLQYVWHISGCVQNMCQTCLNVSGKCQDMCRIYQEHV